MNKSPDITLINVNFPTRLQGSVYYYVPVGVLSLAAYLEREGGYSCQVLDYQHCKSKNPYSLEAMGEFLLQADSDTVGISVMAKDLPLVLTGAEFLKKKRPDTRIILGGAGATGSAKGLLEKFSSVDYVVAGEGEETLLELMTALDRGGDVDIIAGLYHRESSGKVIEGPRRPRITDLDRLPVPAYHLVDPKLYNYIYVPGARGCSHFCTFCDQPALWQGCEIKRSVENLMGEIDYIRRELQAPWGIAFSDNEFCHDPGRFDEFIGLMKKQGHVIPFSMDRRIDAISDESLQKAMEAGCHTILYGIESASPKVLKEINKEFTPDKIIPGLELSSKYINSSVASFIFNYPFETLDDFLETVNVIYQMVSRKSENNVIFQVHYLAPLPRTPIFVKYRDRLIRRNVSSLMTSRDNLAAYRVINQQEKKKILVLPRHSTGPIDEDPRVKAMVEADPYLFPTHYVYDSPNVKVKERILDALEICLKKGITRAMFNVGRFTIYVGPDRVTVAGTPDSGMPAVFVRLGWEDLADTESALNKILQAGPAEVLLSVDKTGMPRDQLSGKALLTLMRKLRDAKARVTLLSHLEEDYLSFIPRLRLTKEFGMPRLPHQAGDLYFIDENNIIRTLNGRAGRDADSYPDGRSIYRNLFERQTRSR